MLQNTVTVFKQPYTRIIENFLIAFIFFIAVSTVLPMAGLNFQAKFSVVAYLIIISTIIISISVIFVVVKIIINQRWKRNDIVFFAGFFCVSFLGTVLSTSIDRPDLDDSVYVPKAVFYKENPDAIIDKSITWIVSPDKLPTSSVLQYYELSQAAFAFFLKKNYLTFYHIIFPGITGFLICLSMFLLLNLFVNKRTTVIFCILFYILLLMALGETHRTYGNLSFARAFHGKFLFLTVGVSSWVYFSLRYFLLRNSLSWVVLLALGIGMAGVTTTAMVFLPLLSLVIFSSYVISESKFEVSLFTIKIYMIYFCTLLPLVLMAIDYRSYAILYLAPGSKISSGFPHSFYGQMQLLINSSYPLTPVIFILSLLIVFFLSEYRRFFISWTAIVFIFILNPIVSDFVINYITTKNIYWRLFYLLPFPLVTCIAVAILFEGQRTKILSWFIFGIFIPLAFWGPTSVLRAENNAEFNTPRYKIGISDYKVCKEIINKTPYGTMFAPIQLSSQIVLLSSHYPQFYLRPDVLKLVLGSISQNGEYIKRQKAYEYLYQGITSRDNELFFLEIIQRGNSPKTMILLNKGNNYINTMELLLKERYELQFTINERYSVFISKNN